MTKLFFSNSVETLAVARNIEDLAAAKITPIIPDKVLQPISREILKSKIASSASASWVSFKHCVFKIAKTVSTFIIH